MTQFGFAHGQCPGKTNIHAPKFVLREKPVHLAKGFLLFYECEGCKTELQVGMLIDDQRTG